MQRAGAHRLTPPISGYKPAACSSGNARCAAVPRTSSLFPSWTSKSCARDSVSATRLPSRRGLMSIISSGALTAVQAFDLVFVGSMDWMPNIDGIRWFLDEVLPRVRATKPDCRVAIVGRNPPSSITAEAKDPLITITGTVADVRPFLWQSAVSIVPLRVGGGTRLKIFEAMAAGTPVVSTTIGAEGLPLKHGETIRIGDTAEAFAAECLDLLNNREARRDLVGAGLAIIREKFSWEQVTHCFEETLRSPRKAAPGEPRR